MKQRSFEPMANPKLLTLQFNQEYLNSNIYTAWVVE
jgi:hypothetical protein